MGGRRKYIEDKFTGIRYEKGSVLGKMTMSPIRPLRFPHIRYPRYTQRKNKAYHESRYRSRGRANLRKEGSFILTSILLLVILAWFAWVNVLQPLILWTERNIVYILSVFAIAIFSVIVYKKKKYAEREMFEAEQRSRGLVKFVNRFENEIWGTPEEIEKQEKEDNEAKIKEAVQYRIIESIKKFTPSRKYGNEFGYHTELQGWLKSHFNNAVVEVQTGASRPDIVIGNIAIEVKGPTDNQALNTLTTKCLKYSQHYTNLIIVLFEPIFSESNYNEIVNGLKRSFPNVEVIRKDNHY